MPGYADKDPTAHAIAVADTSTLEYGTMMQLKRMATNMFTEHQHMRTIDHQDAHRARVDSRRS